MHLRLKNYRKHKTIQNQNKFYSIFNYATFWLSVIGLCNFFIVCKSQLKFVQIGTISLTRKRRQPFSRVSDTVNLMV